MTVPVLPPGRCLSDLWPYLTHKARQRFLAALEAEQGAVQAEAAAYRAGRPRRRQAEPAPIVVDPPSVITRRREEFAEATRQAPKGSHSSWVTKVCGPGCYLHQKENVA